LITWKKRGHPEELFGRVVVVKQDLYGLSMEMQCQKSCLQERTGGDD